MHLMLINHKDIANYIDSNLPKDKVDGWRGVSGRFKHVNLHNNYSQMYEIISAVIHKNEPLWGEFRVENKKRFDSLKDRFIRSGLLEQQSDEDITTAIEGCYPLHPISTFILPRLSEKVAQNERTLFTFLSSDDKYTLSSFLNSSKSGFSLLTPDFIYDYFEPLFIKEPYTSDVYKMYKLTASVLRKVDDKSIHAKILKTISLIYLVEQFEVLSPVVDVIVNAFLDIVNDPKEIDQALKDLIDNECVVYLKRSNNYLKIKETSGVDVRDEIEKYKSEYIDCSKVTGILNDSVFDSFMYPTAYNDDHDIVRYFDFVFIDSAEYFSVTDWSKYISERRADGAIYAIIPKNQAEIDSIRNSILSENSPQNRTVFVLPKKFIDIQADALDYAAVSHLRNEAAALEDEILHDEYTIYFEDLSEVVGSYIDSYAHPEYGSAMYFYNGKQYNFRRKAQFTGLLSKICESVFSRTPIINNESVNKNELPTVAVNSRTKILAGLLANELAPNIGLSGTGQDVSIMRSTLIKTGVLRNVDSDPIIDLAPEDERMRDMLTEISIFFTKKAANKGGANFQTLYDTLTLHENGFGLKYGVIPIFVALILHLYKKNLVILYSGSEVKITPELLNGINENPSEYSVIIEDWNEEKALYMSQLEELFKEDVTEREKAYNSFTYIMLAMSRWYLSLPKFTKEMTSKYMANGKPETIDQAKRKFVDSLKQLNNNPREFLFETVFEIFSMKGFNVNVISIIRDIKSEYDNAVSVFVRELNSSVLAMFAKSKTSGSLTSTIRDWYESLNEQSKNYLYAGSENRILELMASITNDEDLFIQRLAKAATSLRIDDWNNDTVHIFLRDLQAFKKTIEDYNDRKQADTDTSMTYEIIITDANGKRIPKCFNKTEYGDHAKLLFNEIASHLDEYGQSITEQEKRQVLIELLEKLC